MNKKRNAFLHGLVLLIAWPSAGCVSMLNGAMRHEQGRIAGQPREWRWERCYSEPPRPLDEVAVVFVADDPLPLRVNSVDGTEVAEAFEYHLLPGYHQVLVQPVSRGVLTTTSDPVTLGCTLEAGTVYGLEVDVTWEKVTPNLWGGGYSQTFHWSPRIEQFRTCAEAARILRSDEDGEQPGGRPPEHWRLATLDEPRPGSATPAAPAEASVAQCDWDIAEALGAGVVDAEATGAGISLVSLRIKRDVDRPIHVTVPAGTLFACRGSAQNMVALVDTSLDLRDDEWHPVMVMAACVDVARAVPQPSDTFLIQGPAHQKDLRKLMEVLSRDEWPSAVQPRNTAQAHRVAQAAIWIVVGDAGYQALGVLRSTQARSGLLAQLFRGSSQEQQGTRSIDETDAALAMWLVDEAGIDIKAKAIWRDRQAIAQGVPDGALQKWIERH